MSRRSSPRSRPLDVVSCCFESRARGHLSMNGFLSAPGHLLVLSLPVAKGCAHRDRERHACMYALLLRARCHVFEIDFLVFFGVARGPDHRAAGGAGGIACEGARLYRSGLDAGRRGRGAHGLKRICRPGPLRHRAQHFARSRRRLALVFSHLRACMKAAGPPHLRGAGGPRGPREYRAFCAQQVGLRICCLHSLPLSSATTP
jgi:hypothetical protein